MIVEETPDSQKASSKNLLSQYLKKREGTEASVRQLSSEAKLKLILDPAFARLNSHEKIVSMDHESERYVPAIDNANYHERNYLARQVVKTSELDGQMGPKIDILSPPAGHTSVNRYVAQTSTGLF